MEHLVLATKLGDKAAVQRLCAQNPNAAMDNTGVMAIQVAASMGNLEVANVLLKAGASYAIDTATRAGMTALMLAAAGGHTAMVELLFNDANADATLADHNAWTALHHAAFGGHADTCAVLIQVCAADPNAVSSKQETPLALAALMENSNACQVLLTFGADVELLTAESDRQFVQGIIAQMAEEQENSNESKASKNLTVETLADTYDDDFCQPVTPSTTSAQQQQKSFASPKVKASAGKGGGTDNITQPAAPSFAVPMPTGPRRASPIYIQPDGSETTSNNPAVIAAEAAKAGADGDWPLQAFAYKGCSEGFLLDASTGLVYWLEPGSNQNATINVAPNSPAACQQFAGSPARSLRAALPILVGKMIPGMDGFGNPSSGVIVPLNTEDCATVELSNPAVRCLRRHNPAAALLLAAARQGKPVAADLAPELGAPPYCKAISLAVPLCAVLGLNEVSELASLTARDLVATEVDESFLPALQRLADLAAPSTPSSKQDGAAWPADSPRPDTARGNNIVNGLASPRPAGTTTVATSLPVLPTLSQLLMKHGLAKLLPVAAECKLLSLSELHRWRELSAAAAPVPLSQLELTRLKALSKSIQRAQEQAVMLQASRLQLLNRITVGSLVHYEADPVQAISRGERLAGIVLEDLGSDAIQTNCMGKQYKVRDLLDDTIVWQSPGQLRLLPYQEAIQYLRCDLLPPAPSSTLCGTPVTSLTAEAGMWVQLTPWAKTSILMEYTAAGIPADVPGDGMKPGSNDDAQSRALLQVVGVLLEPATEDKLWWSVSWPDGVIRQHCVGANGRFDLAHMQLHRLAGAPFTRSQFQMLLAGKELLAIPFVRAPHWPRPSVDDGVPGSPGLGFIDAAQAAVTVVWSRSRTQGANLYCPDAQGSYPLCHALLGGHPISCLAAKPGVLVEAAAGAPPQAVALAAQGPGSLIAPVSFDATSNTVTWRVKWPSGIVSTHELGTAAEHNELQVSETYMVGSIDRVVLLNEVSKRGPCTAATISALAGAMRAGCCGCGVPGCSGNCKRPLLGRPLFSKDPARAHQWGMLGSLVKLNLGAVGLQPGCEEGPLAAYEPMPLAEQLALKKEGTLGPIPRDDVGLVVKDAGPGTWRGLLVRKLGSTQSWWYDESVILPATAEDVKKQVVRCGQAYLPPRHLQGVPVTDATAAPGMLVQRAYAAGAAQDGSEKAQVVGELLCSVGANTWKVKWPDGSTGVFKTGANNRFQLCYVNLHELAGAPLLARTVDALADIGVHTIPVTDGPHFSGGVTPGAVRFVNEPLTQQGLELHELAQLAACGMVITSGGERCVAGGPLKLFELSHAIKAGDAVTVFTAKRGLRVMLASDEESASAANKDDDSDMKPQPRVGVLRNPTRLAVKAVIDAGSGAGSGMPGGPTASREPILLQDPAVVYWEVEWPNGRVEEVLVGTTAAQTPLRIASDVGQPAAEEEENGEEAADDLDSSEDQVEPAALYGKLVKSQHFVRMLEPVMLLPCNDADMKWALERAAVPLQRAIVWTNQVMRELCAVWWAAASLTAAANEACGVPGDGFGGRHHLWRPHITPVPSQPDLLTLALRKRGAGALRWQTVVVDEDDELSGRVSTDTDKALALALSLLTQLVACPELTDSESSTTAGVKHLALDSSGRLLEEGLLLNALGVPEEPSEAAEAALKKFNDTVTDFRTALRNDGLSANEPFDPDMPAWDLLMLVEPSLSTAKGPGSAVLGIVHDTPPRLGDTESESVVQPVGPLAVLASKCQAIIQAAVVEAHRSLGAYNAAGQQEHKIAVMQPGGAPLEIVGDAQPRQWLAVPEGLFPQNVGTARCLASVNSQVFNLRRICACLNGCAGGGTANIAKQLMGVLKVVREKTQAALAIRACRNLLLVSDSAKTSAAEAIEKHSNGATDIKAFDHEALSTLLSEVTAALQHLVLAEAYAEKACGYAAAGRPPEATPAIEPKELEDADKAALDSNSCLDDVVDTLNSLYPTAIDAIKQGTITMTASSRSKLLQAHDLFQILKSRQQALAEARKQADVTERAARSAEEDCSAAKQNKERKDGELEKAKKNAEAAELALKEAHQELDAAKVATPQSHDDDPEAASRAATTRINTAEANVQEMTERVTKMNAFLEQTAQEALKAAASVEEEERKVSSRRAEAEQAKQATAQAQDLLNRANKEARALDPGSMEELEENKKNTAAIANRMDKQVLVAQKVVDVAKASLAALESMSARAPQSLRAREAIARYLDRSISMITLIAAAAAAECARTSSLPLEEFLLDLEQQESIMAAMPALASGGPLSASGSLSSSALNRSVVSGTSVGGGSNGHNHSSPALIPTLPAISEVTRLMDCIKKNVLGAVNTCSILLPQIPDETTIVDNQDPSKTLNRAVLTSATDRVLLTAVTTLEKLGAASAQNVSAYVAEAANANSGNANAGGAPAAAAASANQQAAAEALAKALRAARVATMVAETARSLPATSADMPTSDTKLATQLMSQLRAAQNHSNQANKDVMKLANELTVKLGKSGLGQAATSASVLCFAYAELARDASSAEESGYWCQEAVTQFPKARGAADAALAALAPQPVAAQPHEGGSDVEEEEPAEKKKDDPAELAAKTAAAEAERAIKSHIAEVAVQICRASVDWALKVMSPLSDSSSIEEVTKQVALAVAELRPDALTAGASSCVSQPIRPASPVAGQDGGNGSEECVKEPAAVHPDAVVAGIQALSAPLQIADMTFRQACNHGALDAIDTSIKDALSTVAEAARTRARYCNEGLDGLLEQLGTRVQELDHRQLKDIMQCCTGLVACAVDAIYAAQSLFSVVPLILPEEKAVRQLKEAAACRDEMMALGRQITDAAQLALADKVVVMPDTACNSSVPASQLLQAALTPQYTQLMVRLERTTVPATRPGSPLRRGAARKSASPAALQLSLSIPAPTENYQKVCDDVTEYVFQQASVQALLAPYHALLQASNEAATAIHNAAASEPSEAEIALLTNPTAMPPVATAASERTFNISSREQQMQSANALQLQRWGTAVANMSAAVKMVQSSFVEAEQSCSDNLDSLELLWLPSPATA